MATLNELKTQITNANTLGKSKITAKGGTVAQDADTVTIMNAIDSIPSGGGAAPTVVNEITWDGDTEGLETQSFGDVTLYKISDDVLPFYYLNEEGGIVTYTQTDESGESYEAYNVFATEGCVILSREGYTMFVVYMANHELIDGFSLPSVGTWSTKIDEKYWKSVVATSPFDGE